MITRWFLFGSFIFFPALGLLLFLSLLALVRYWAEYNAESIRVLTRIKSDIDAKKVARRSREPEHPAMEAVKVEASAEAKSTQVREKEFEARKKAMESLDTRALATLIKTMMAQDELGPRAAVAKK